jgi:predicted PhzF superfamily epimerase YddE/YHI9
MPPSYVATQGRPLGRDGRVTIDVGPDGRIAVGGATTTGVRGSLLA